MQRVNSSFMVLALAFVANGVQAVTWDVVYDGDALPDQAAPSWVHSQAGGASTLGTDGTISFLRVSNYNGSTWAANEWKRENDPYMADTRRRSFEFDNPLVAGVTWERMHRDAFTVEWRMRIVDRPTTDVADGVGVKLRIPREDGNRVLLEMYYDKTNQCVRNARYAWGAHPGKTGEGGSESALNNDGFPGIAPGTWHTYKVVYWRREGGGGLASHELWLDGAYIGRWDSDILEGVTTEPVVTMQAGAGSSPEAAVEFDYVRWANEPDGKFARPVPAPAAPTLLLNQSFDEPTGPMQGWFGAFFDNTGRPPASPYQNIDGSGRWGNALGSGSGNTKTWQTVAVPPGETVSFQGYICAKGTTGVTGSTSVNVVTLFDGQTTTSPVIASGTVDEETPITTGQWAKLTLSGVCASGHVTVLLDSTLNTVTDVAAAYADGFSLTSTGPACAGQFALTSVSPASAPRGPAATLTIYGTDLDKASSVKLVNIAAQKTVACSIVSQTANSLAVSVPTAGENLAKYNVVVAGPNCSPVQLVEAFEIICSSSTTMTGLSPASLSIPQGSVEFTITGTGLDPAQTTFKLVMGATEILGINPHMVGSDLKISFDLSSAPMGFYGLVAESANPCAVPAPLIGALGYLPSVGQELLVNGDFDTGMIVPWTETSCLTDVLGDAGVGPQSPTWFLGASSIGGEEGCEVEQEVMVENGEHDVTLVFWGWVYRSAHQDFASGYDNRVTGEILADGNVVASVTVSNLDRPMQTWIPAAVQWQGIINFNSLKARITIHADGRDPHGPYQYLGVAAADSVRLFVSGMACNNPFADADGDHDVDQVDFGVFQACFTGQYGSIPAEPAYCGCFNRPEGNPAIADNDIDSVDMAKFELCASGPAILADTACDGTP